MGVGLYEGREKINGLILRRIFGAWLLTMPGAAFIAALVMLLTIFFV